MIQLQNEGVVQAPPLLPTHAQHVALEIQSWPEVFAATHWKLGDPTRMDGAEFHLPQGALGHIHIQGGGLHLALTKSLREALVRRGLAAPFRWDAAWVEHPIANAKDAEQAIWLFRLAYDRLRSVPEETLIERIDSQASA